MDDSSMIISQYPGLCRRPCRRHNLRLGFCSDVRWDVPSRRASRAFRFSGQRKTWRLHWKDVISAHGVVTLNIDISRVKSPNKTSWVRKGWMLTWKHHLTVWWTYLVSYRYLVTFLTSQWNHLGHLGFQAGGGATGASAAFWAILTLQNATGEK